MEVPQTSYTSRNGTTFWWEELPCKNCLGAGRSQVHAVLVWHTPVSRVSLGSFFQIAASVRLGKGSTQLAGLVPSADSIPGAPRYPPLLPPKLTIFQGKGLIRLLSCSRSSPTLPCSAVSGEMESRS